mmetsp:Transcript_45682/g.97118  ORF Transcript_45682/g.97118 Transcript_45682/m.97118 type:complete len:118 (-) Transcript_45682:213-566(-)
MKQFASVLALIFLAPAATAFLAPASSPPRGGERRRSDDSARFARKKGRRIDAPRPLPSGPPAQDIRLPDDCTMDDLIAVMGEGRLKKIARKNRRVRNQKIREGKVALNEKGEWVPRE